MRNQETVMDSEEAASISNTRVYSQVQKVRSLWIAFRKNFILCMHEFGPTDPLVPCQSLRRDQLKCIYVERCI